MDSRRSKMKIDYGADSWRDSAHYDYQLMIKNELSFSEKISKYIKMWISTVDTNVSPLISSEIMGDSIFLSFNYTDTLESVYKIPEEKILYIAYEMNIINYRTIRISDLFG